MAGCPAGEFGQYSAMDRGRSHDTTMAHLLSTSLELWLHQHNHRRARSEQAKRGRDYQAKRNERHVDRGEIRWLGQRIQIANVCPIECDHARLGRQASVELTSTDVDSIDARRPALK